MSTDPEKLKKLKEGIAARIAAKTIRVPRYSGKKAHSREIERAYAANKKAHRPHPASRGGGKRNTKALWAAARSEELDRLSTLA